MRGVIQIMTVAVLLPIGGAAPVAAQEPMHEESSSSISDRPITLHSGDTVGARPAFTVTKITESSMTLASGPWLIRYDIGTPNPVIETEAEKP